MLKTFFYILHMLGLAGLLVTLVLSLRKSPKRLSAGVLHSAWLQLISGLALTGIDSGKTDFNYLPVFIKLGILVVILVLGYKNVKKSEIKSNLIYLLLALTLFNVLIASVIN